ncbi:MAG: hypothetical protein FJY92_08670, partial [Candidatus Hydrogenedentes bacterium]|nr:hypothetical protein [Candidatus Hydrogenedentota bacterium]
MARLTTNAGLRVFVSWWKYTSRPDSFARAIGAKNYFFAQGAQFGLLKYFPRAWCCFWTLVRERPRIVIASNPPVLAPLVVWFYCLLFNARFCMDSHTSAFDRPRWERLMWLTAFLGRRAVWAATTNEELTSRLAVRGVNGIVIEDIPFEMPETSYPVEAGRFSVAVVCSFDVDEPIAEIIEAARTLSDVRFYVTGNPKKAAPSLVHAKPANVTFTGFLSENDYAGLLRSASAVLVLTTHDLTMQRGGSEAITVKKPLITSR